MLSADYTSNTAVSLCNKHLVSKSPRTQQLCVTKTNFHKYKEINPLNGRHFETADWIELIFKLDLQI